MEETILEKHLAEEPLKENDSKSLEWKKAYEYFESGKYQEGLSYLNRNSQMTSTATGQVLLGCYHQKLGDITSALSHWKKATEISPLEHAAYTNIAAHYYSIGKLNEAIYNWTIASTIMPESPSINLNLALAYDKKGSRIKSTKYFEKFLKYEKNTQTHDYVMVKQRFANLMAKADFYAKKVEEFKLQKDLQIIAALYLKMLSVYALLPSVYNNIAEIFSFDKNYEKALEFNKIIYLHFPFTNKILIEMANLSLLLDQKSYAYVYYHRTLKTLPEGTSYHTKVTNLLKTLSTVVNDPDVIEFHRQKAEEAVANNDYETAVDEYENYLILTDTENLELQQTIDKYKIFVNPEPFVINVLYNQIPELMNRKKLNACIDVCDRIISMAKDHSKEVVYALKCKSDCKRIIIAREQFGI